MEISGNQGDEQMRNLNRAGMSAGRIAGERALNDARRRLSTKMSRQTKSTRTSRLSRSQVKSADRSSLIAANSFASKYQSSSQNTTLEKKYYTEMGEAAESLQDRVSLFLKRGENTLFGKQTEVADNGGTTVTEEQKNKLVKEIEGFVDDYNTMRKSMGNIGGQVRQVYIQQLDKQVNKQEKTLAEIGISKGKDGILSVKSSVLKESDLEKIKLLFGTVDSFADNIGNISNAVEKNARDNLYELKFSSYSSNYSRNGSYRDSYSSIGKRYNVRG